MPPDPQRITFEGEHSTMVGYYYPAAELNAPVIVLMHWARGTQQDWCLIAPWLQNRGDENPPMMPGCEEAIAQADPLPGWWDASWFPPRPEGSSYAVFTFDFPGFGESKGAAYVDATVLYRPHRARSDWNISQKDLLAAMETAAQLPGVDASRIVAMGASIGGDGAAEGCLAYNQAHGGGCVGAFAISPGGFLGTAYGETAAALAAASPDAVQWCAASWNEKDVCLDAADAGSVQQPVVFPEGHGMDFFAKDFFPMKPGRDATIMDFVNEFLAAAFGEN